MKRLWTLVLSLILAAALGGSALAAASAEVIRAFVQGDTLYAYVELTGSEAPITKAEAGIGTRTFAASGRAQKPFTIPESLIPETWQRSASAARFFCNFPRSTSSCGYCSCLSLITFDSVFPPDQTAALRFL